MEHATAWGVIELITTIVLIVSTCGLAFVTLLNLETENHRHEENIVREVIESQNHDRPESHPEPHPDPASSRDPETGSVPTTGPDSEDTTR